MWFVATASRSRRIRKVQQKTAPVLKMDYNAFQLVEDAMVLAATPVKNVQDVVDEIDDGNIFDKLF